MPILPDTCVFKPKRNPDGEIYCVRCDLQESEQENYSPVMNWSSICIMLTLFWVDGPAWIWSSRWWCWCFFCTLGVLKKRFPPFEHGSQNDHSRVQQFLIHPFLDVINLCLTFPGPTSISTRNVESNVWTGQHP